MIIWHSGCKIVDINELWNLGYNFLCHPVPHFLGGIPWKITLVTGGKSWFWAIPKLNGLSSLSSLYEAVVVYSGEWILAIFSAFPCQPSEAQTLWGLLWCVPHTQWENSGRVELLLLVQSAFFLFSRRRPRIFVSSENDGPSLVKVIGENECTEYTEITYFQPSLRCFQGTRETMASHFLSIPEQQREVSLRMYLFQIQGVPILLGHFLDFDRSILGLTARIKDNQEKR